MTMSMSTSLLDLYARNDSLVSYAWAVCREAHKLGLRGDIDRIAVSYDEPFIWQVLFSPVGEATRELLFFDTDFNPQNLVDRCMAMRQYYIYARTIDEPVRTETMEQSEATKLFGELVSKLQNPHPHAVLVFMNGEYRHVIFADTITTLELHYYVGGDDE